ncbi:MAG: hypothetical protein IKA03_02220 [Alphaproteobacteria bacterium]|nr:hypothetical protein [Alphaproteobacteria bacterium]
MKNLYMFFMALAIAIVAFSPAEAQRKNTTKHDREPINVSEPAEMHNKKMKITDNKDECNCEEIKKCCKHCKKMHKKEKREHKKKHKEY